MAALLIAAALPKTALACATCGCSLSTEAAMGYASEPGWRASLQYDFLNQSQLRSGTRSISASQVAAINDAGGDQEVERDTLNRYLTFGLSYTPSADWSLRLLVPYIDRGHSTYAAATNPITPDQLSATHIAGLGDVRFIASYQGLLASKALGLQLGLKLPTGNYGGPSADGMAIVGHHPASFTSGPLAQNPSPGNLVDTSLQAGNGSTDLILGAYFHQPVSDNLNAFVNAQFQASVSHRLDQAGQDYRPGNTFTTSFGVRYEASPDFVPQIQVNIARKGADQGALADSADTAGTIVYVAPGMSAAISTHVQGFAFVQVPLYSNLSGIQLAPKWTASAGLSYAF